MRPIRVLLTIPELVYGGAERQLVELASRLDPRRFRVAVAALRAGGALEGEARRRGVEALHTARQGRFDLSPILRLAAFAVKRRVDVTHSFLFFDALHGRLAAALAGVPVRIASLRGVDYAPGSLRNYVDRALLSLTDCLVANSEWMRDRARRCGLRRARIEVIRNGVDAARFDRPAERERVRRELGIARKAVAVGMVGRLSREKGVDVFMRCAARVAEECADAVFVVVGDGPERGALERMAGSPARVVMTGWRDDVGETLSALDVLALTSRSESAPNAALEAMAAGLPVVATRVGGTPEIVEDEVTGLLAPSEDVAGLSERLTRLCRSAALRRMMGRRGRRRIEERFSMRRMVERYEALYEELVGRGRR